MAVTDYFAALGVAASCELDRAQLDRNYRQLQAQWHPDRFVNAGEVERMNALQHTSLINDAYATLKQPLKRAEHLLELQDTDGDSHKAPKLDTAFLLQQLALREQLEQLALQRDAAGLETLHQQVAAEWIQHWHGFVAEAGRQDWCNARLSLQKLQFLHKLQEEIRHLEE